MEWNDGLVLPGCDGEHADARVDDDCALGDAPIAWLTRDGARVNPFCCSIRVGDGDAEGLLADPLNARMGGVDEFFEHCELGLVEPFVAEDAGDDHAARIPSCGLAFLEEDVGNTLSSVKRAWLGLAGEDADEHDEGEEDAECDDILGYACLPAPRSHGIFSPGGL